jgi:hypothetical protein
MTGARLPSFDPRSRKKEQSRFDALVDRGLFAVVLGAESGSRLLEFLFDLLVERASPAVKARIATQLVDFSLRELTERLQVLPDEAAGNWPSLKGRLRERLAGLTVARDDLRVFWHGDVLLREVSDATGRPLLKTSRRKLEDLAVNLGFRGEGGTYSPVEIATGEFGKPTTRVLRVQHASRDLLSELELLGERAMAAAGPPELPELHELPDPPPRYADYVVFNEDELGERMEKLGPEAPLQEGRKYELEVAVRGTPIGVETEEERKPFRMPHQSGDVVIYVVVTSDGFEIPEPVQKLLLPPTGDSKQNARFRGIAALRKTTSPDNLLTLEIRLYYEMNLLEIVTIRAEVVGKFDSNRASLLNLRRPIDLHQRQSEQEYLDFDLIRPRSMNIAVERHDAGYRFTFILKREDKGNEVPLTGVLRVPEMEVESILAEARKILLGISVDDVYEGQIECKNPIEFAKRVNRLARIGSDLWTLLFRRKMEGALFAIGELLQTFAPPARSVIQISLHQNAATFVFPWSLLFDKTVPPDSAQLPDLDGFWGLRYQVEQRIPGLRSGTDEAISVNGVLRLALLLWRFREAEEEEKVFDEFVGLSKGRISPPSTIDSAKEAYEYLQNCEGHIIYFFSHGHTQLVNAERYGFSVADFIRMYEHLPKKDAKRKAWKQMYDDIKKGQFEPDQSWIMLQHGKIFLRELYRRAVLLKGTALVFLNMCESAQVTPSLSESFIYFFADRGARNVLGTECSMRPLFAHYFAKEIFDGLLAGKPIGEVLLDVRNDFIRRRNPLGLAYTLFGPTTMRFEPTPIQPSTDTFEVLQ